MHFVMPASHIQRSPAEFKFVDRQKVVEFQTRQGVERIFRFKYTLSHFWTGLGKCPLNKSPGARQYITGIRRSPLDLRAGAVRVSVDN